MKPDVVVKTTRETILFEPQNQRASDWLHQRCGFVGETVTGGTEFKVHPSRSKEMVEELKAAGFEVAD
jgi:hypothetical protein